MIHSNPPHEEALLQELQHELRRLESERARAVKKRDHVFAVVETGDDTGHSLNVALTNLKRIEDRIEQVRNLITTQQQRARDDP